MSGFGFVQFDQPEAPAEGWAALANEKARRISSLADLASDVIWLTNIGYDTFRKLQLQNHPNLKRADYLRSSVKAIMTELGIEQRFMASDKSTQLMAEIFGRIVRICQDDFGVRWFRMDKLVDDLFPCLMNRPQPVSPEFDAACDQAYQTDSNCGGISPKGSKLIGFRRARVAHAMDILDSPVPDGQWKFMPDAELPQDQKERLNYLCQLTVPVLARVSVNRMDPDKADIVAFSVSSVSDAKFRKMRTWACHTELLWLAEYATEIRIESAFIGNGYQSLRPACTLQPSPADHCSYSFGIVAENYWRSLASKYSGQVSAQAAWLMAADRFWTFTAAERLSQAGLSVSSYGSGVVYVRVRAGEMENAMYAAKEAGLLYPLSVAADIAVQKDLESTAKSE